MAELNILKLNSEGKERFVFDARNLEDWISQRITEEGQYVLLPNIEDLKTKNADMLVADAYRRIIIELMNAINYTKEGISNVQEEKKEEKITPTPQLTPPKQLGDDDIVL